MLSVRNRRGIRLLNWRIIAACIAEHRFTVIASDAPRAQQRERASKTKGLNEGAAIVALIVIRAAPQRNLV